MKNEIENSKGQFLVYKDNEQQIQQQHADGQAAGVECSRRLHHG